MKFAQANMSARQHFEPLPEMDDRQFRQWVKLLEKRIGTSLPPERKSFLVTNIGLRMREIGCRDYQQYYDKIHSGVDGMHEWCTLVDRLTVHETRFFRHPASLELVGEYVSRKPVDSRSGNISIHAWSVACATGEEAYSMAMVIDRCLQERHEPGFFGVTATDISPGSLQTARAGVYTSRRVAQLDESMIFDYFEPVEKQKYRVREYLRKRVCFARMNILDIANEPLGEMDIIYCQNLLIYFDRDARESIVNNMARHLLPGGILILGSGEILSWDNPQMQKIGKGNTLAYRRLGEVG